MTGQRGRTLTRRRVLAKAACLGAVAGLAGCPEGRSPSPSTDPPATTSSPGRPESASDPHRDFGNRFERVVDVVEAGGDPDGDRAINDVLREHATEDTLLVFPDGTYRLEPIRLSLPRNLGLVAAAGAEPGLLPGSVSRADEWFIFSDAEEVVVDGIDFAYDDAESMGGTVVRGPGPIEIRDLHVRGAYDPDSQQLMRIDVTDPDGVADVENVVARGVDEQGVNATGIYVGRYHAGEITIRNCRLDRFSDNAVYASPPGGEGGEFDAAGGAVHVRGGRFRNNNIAAIRIGSHGSTVRDVTVEVDRTPPHIDENSLNARGIRLRGQHDQLVENCRLVYGTDAGATSGAITLNERNGNATIRNVEIQVDRDDVNALLAKEPAIDGDVAPTLENVTVRGTAANGEAITIVGRSGARFQGCCVRQSGQDRDGIELVDSSECSVDDSQIEVSGESVVLRNSSLVSEYTPAESCPD